LAGVVAPTNLLFEDYLVVTGAQMPDDDAYKIANPVRRSGQARLHRQDLGQLRQGRAGAIAASRSIRGNQVLPGKGHLAK
jgi:hypothetical protein